MSKPTEHQLTDLAARVVAAFRRPPRRQALDGAITELAILIGNLCPTTNEAQALTEQLLARAWDRWDYAALRAYAERCRRQQPSGAPAPITTAADWGLEPDEFEALSRRIGPKPGQPADLLVAIEQAMDAAEALVDALPPDRRQQLLDLARADFTSFMRQPHMEHLQSRTLEPPFLDRNAHDVAVARAHRHLLLGRPLMEPWPVDRASKSNPRPIPRTKAAAAAPTLKHL